MKIIVNEPDKYTLKVIQTQNNESITIKEIASESQPIIKIGELGSPGLSAYELSVQNGFQGSLNDWLNKYNVSVINGGIIF